jgi:TPR repeat protein
MLPKRILSWFVAGVALLLSVHVLADDFANALAAYDKHDYSTAVQLFEPLAERGDMRAALFLGAAYYTGLGVRFDRPKSIGWMLQAQSSASSADYDFVYGHWQTLADAGDPDAQLALGTAYNTGFGVPADPKKAFALMQQSAAQGYAPGQHGLGTMYASGDGVRKDAAEAVKWFSLAAEQGFTRAQGALAGMYQTGNGVKKDKAAAIAWLRRSADNGGTQEQYELGIVYDEGNGVRADTKEAVKWYRLAAAGGSPLAQNNLAVHYLKGTGVSKDPVLAYEFSTHAMNGVNLVSPEFHQTMRLVFVTTGGKLSDTQKRAALFQLGERCRDGDGVPQDDVLAYHWMDMSVHDEPDESLRTARQAERDRLAERMRPDQVARAQTLSRSML